MNPALTMAFARRCSSPPSGASTRPNHSAPSSNRCWVIQKRYIAFAIRRPSSGRSASMNHVMAASTSACRSRRPSSATRASGPVIPGAVAST